MSTTEELIAYHREWVRLHRANPYQREGTRRMTEVLDALESARRDALMEAKNSVEATVIRTEQAMVPESEYPALAARRDGGIDALRALDALIGDETGEQK